MKMRLKFCKRHRSVVRAMSGIHLNGGKRSEELMAMLDLNETIDQLAWQQTMCIDMVMF